MKSIVKLIPYFGRWPDWFELYLLSCRYNPDVDWLFFTDCEVPVTAPDNVRFIQISFSDYKDLVSERLGIYFNPSSPYKLCDLKPAYGYLHYEQIRDYDFFAFGDIDIIYGQIRNFITDDILKRYEVIGTHRRRLSGHFSLFRNTERNRNAFLKISNWRQLMETDEHIGIDESSFSKIFVPHKNHPHWLQKLWSVSSPYQRRVLFREQFSTVLSPISWCDGQTNHPQNWFWEEGHLTNERDRCEFMYLHFMNWKSARWLPKPVRQYGAAWNELDQLVTVDLQTAKDEGFQISPAGFTPIISASS